ncbi:hypothetical protein R3P38DRAFT_2787767 [Favolaschia claudopus]|uniref:Uncharacterized protein n=1 Tax=Favolaschia claudopus TaxID=2862362 RepID=A0AAW0ALZ0_9AGAR
MPIQGCHSTDLPKSQDEREKHHQLTQHLASPVGFILPMFTKIEFFAGPISFLPSSITLPHLSLSGISARRRILDRFSYRVPAARLRQSRVSETSRSQRPICRLTWSADKRIGGRSPRGGFTCPARTCVLRKLGMAASLILKFFLLLEGTRIRTSLGPEAVGFSSEVLVKRLPLNICICIMEVLKYNQGKRFNHRRRQLQRNLAGNLHPRQRGEGRSIPETDDGLPTATEPEITSYSFRKILRVFVAVYTNSGTNATIKCDDLWHLEVAGHRLSKSPRRSQMLSTFSTVP